MDALNDVIDLIDVVMPITSLAQRRRLVDPHRTHAEPLCRREVRSEVVDQRAIRRIRAGAIEHDLERLRRGLWYVPEVFERMDGFERGGEAECGEHTSGVGAR